MSLPATTDSAHVLSSASSELSPFKVRGHAGWIAAFRIALTRSIFVVVAALLLVTRSRWSLEAPVLSAAMVTLGLLLTGVGAAGRLWCSLYIAGKKNRSLVTEGPYSICRNPLYFFSLAGACGAAMATGMITVPLILAAIFMIGYRPVILAEEKRLRTLFGEDYDNYCSRVPRFLPKWELLHHGEPAPATPKVFLNHAKCVIWFPAAAGFFMLLSAVAGALHLPVWFQLY